MVSAILLIPLGLSILRDRAIWVLRVPQIQIFIIIGVLFLSPPGGANSNIRLPLPEKRSDQPPGASVRHPPIWLICFSIFHKDPAKRCRLTVWVAVGLILAAAVTALPGFSKRGGGVEPPLTSVCAKTRTGSLISVCLQPLRLVYRSYANSGRWEKLLTLPLLGILPGGRIDGGLAQRMFAKWSLWQL